MAQKISHPKIPASIKIPNKDLASVFFEAAEDANDNPFTAFEGKIKTYKEAKKEINQLSNALLNLGVNKGDRVALLMPNCPQFLISYLAIVNIGAIVTAISPLYTEKEIKFQVVDSGSETIITLDMFLDKIRKIRNLTSLRNVIVSSIGDELSSIKGFLYKKVIARKNPKPDKNELVYTEIIKNASDKRPETKINPKEDLVCLQYTGGTTGVPKGAMLTHRNLVSQATVLKYWAEWVGGYYEGVQTTHIGALPFSHIFGLTTSFLWPMSVGGMICLIPDPRKLEDIMKVVEKYQIQFFMAVPILYHKLAEHPKTAEYDWSSVRMSISGGSALHPKTMELFEEKTGAVLVEGYGLSEASPVTHINPIDRELREISIGIPIPNVQTKIVNFMTNEEIDYEFDSEEKLTTEGELWVKGPQVMKGYWNKPEETAEVLKQDGWLRTGDVVRKNENDFFFIVDRLKDCIFTSGFQVWPLEVETALCNHPDISLAAVIPYKDEQANEVVKAVIVPKQGAKQLSHAELKSYCKKQLAPYKVPKYFEYREELPLSAVGKVLRRPLKEEAKREIQKKVLTK